MGREKVGGEKVGFGDCVVCSERGCERMSASEGEGSMLIK